MKTASIAIPASDHLLDLVAEFNATHAAMLATRSRAANGGYDVELSAEYNCACSRNKLAAIQVARHVASYLHLATRPARSA